MTRAERLLWERTQRRAAEAAPKTQAAILRAYKIISTNLSSSDITKYVKAGDTDALLDAFLNDSVFNTAMRQFSLVQRDTVSQSVLSTSRNELPSRVSASFNILNPDIIEGIRTLESKVIDALASNERDLVRAIVEDGLARGANARVIGQYLQDAVGLGPSQWNAVQSFREALITGDYSNVLGRELRDGRYDRLLQSGKTLTAAQIETQSMVYAKNFVAFNAETIARTATLDAEKAGQRMAWQDAIDTGQVDADSLMKRWRGVLDDREREEHVDMEGEEVAFDDVFSNDETDPGDSTYNCRCIAVVFIDHSA